MIAATKTKKPTAPANLIPACAYIRMSTDDQKESPEQQRAEIAKLATKHGCRVVREYFDAGISGADTKKRKQFNQMMEDAERGEFSVILAWDQDRFSRADPMKAAAMVDPLRDRGIRLITVAQGVIDWDDFGNQLVWFVNQRGKHQFLVDLSRNTTRGFIAKFMAGNPHARPPWGYDRAVYNEQGKLMQLVPFGETFIKPKTWKSKFVPTKDKQIIRTIREAFDRYDQTAITLRGLAIDFNNRGIRSPTGIHWSQRTIKSLLANPVYVGDISIGRCSKGKFHRIGADGEIKSARKDGSQQNDEFIVVKDVHKPIISRDQFNRVQARMKSLKSSGRRPKSNDYFVTELMRCGLCGKPMNGKTMRRKGRKNTLRYYVCAGNRIGECAHAINADYIERAVLELIQESLLASGDVNRLRKEILSQCKAAANSTTPANSRAAKNQIAKLNAQIEKAVANLLSIDAEYIPMATKKIDAMRAERDELVRASQADATATPDATPEQMAKIALDELMRLREGLDGDDPLAVREVCNRLISSITVFSEVVQESSRKQHRPLKAVVEFGTHVRRNGPGLLRMGVTKALQLHGGQTLKGVEWRRELRNIAMQHPELSIRTYCKETGLCRATATMRLWRAVQSGLLTHVRRGRWALAPHGSEISL